MADKRKIVDWIVRIIPAVILGQTLFFKFTGAPESVYIFETIGAEPWGRLASGAFEGVAAVLLLLPGTVWLGAIMAIGMMLGAIGSHLTVLGIEVQGDGGTLFVMAIVVLIFSTTALIPRLREVPVLKGFVSKGQQ